MIRTNAYTPDMRKLIDVINAAQGETPWILVGMEQGGGEMKLVFVPNPNFKPTDETK